MKSGITLVAFMALSASMVAASGRANAPDIA